MTVYSFLATGFEEIEGLTPVDVLRRAGIEALTVSVTDSKMVVGTHGVPVMADCTFDEIDGMEADMLVLPGGMPGADNLNAHKGLSDLLVQFAASGKPIAAICAAPYVLGVRGLLNGRKATCYPGFEKVLAGATCTGALVEEDGQFITGKGPGAAMDFAFALLNRLCGAQVVRELKAGMIVGK